MDRVPTIESGITPRAPVDDDPGFCSAIRDEQANHPTKGAPTA